MFALIDTPDGRRLVDADSLATLLHLAKRTLRRHMEPAACDRQTRTNLYDLDTACDTLGHVKPRRRATASLRPYPEQ